MNLVNKALCFSLIIVWISIFIKHKPFGYLRAANSYEIDESEPNSRRRFRFRETFRKGVQKVIDKTNGNKDLNDEQDLDDFNNEDDSRRVTSRIRSGFRKIKTRLKPTPSITKSFTPIYRFETKKKISYSLLENAYDPEDFNVPYKPGSMNYSIMIELAKKIIRSGNYMSNGVNNHDFQLGYFNDYNYKPDQYSNVTGLMCSNYLEYGGVIFGKFYCPIEGYSLASTKCCGEINEEHCCEPIAISKKATQENSHFIYFYLLIIISIVLFVLILLALILITKKGKTFRGSYYKTVKKNEQSN